MPTLVVIGAGPKGIAIAAKARALAAVGLEAPETEGRRTYAEVKGVKNVVHAAARRVGCTNTIPLQIDKFA